MTDGLSIDRSRLNKLQTAPKLSDVDNVKGGALAAAVLLA
jgi:hypothetical protein